MKTLIIGIDGGTWKVMDNLIKKGMLPTIKKLKEKGASGVLKSTIPPVTGPAWISMATGMNPGKTGVFDFFTKTNFNYEVRAVNSNFLKGRAFWDLLSEKHKKVAMINYPTLYPCYKINGAMISGITGLNTSKMAYPPELSEKIREMCKDYRFEIPYIEKKYDDPKYFFQELNKFLDDKLKIVNMLLEEEWDLFFLVFSCTDWIQHLFWKYIDSDHVLYSKEEAKMFEKYYFKFWKRLDKEIENIIRKSNCSHIFLVSDHGFGAHDECFDIKTFLEDKGYLKSKKNIYIGIIKKIMKKLREYRIEKIIPYKLQELAIRYYSNIKIGQINLRKSKVYLSGHSKLLGAIYINKKGRERFGTISKYNSFKNKLIADLKSVEKIYNINVEIYDPLEIYTGSFVDYAPDIMFSIDNWRCIVTEKGSDLIFVRKPSSENFTGSHRLEGIFIAHGPGIKSDYRLDASIYDIAPTVLHMFGLSIPTYMDGRVLTEIFKEDSKLAKREGRYIEEKEEDKIKEKIKKLKGMGKI